MDWPGVERGPRPSGTQPVILPDRSGCGGAALHSPLMPGRQGGQRSSRAAPRAAERARPTLEVVAASAGVSRATASRVLRGASNVSDGGARGGAPGRRRALLHRQPGGSVARHPAQRLRSPSSSPRTEDRMFGDPYFLGVLRGAQAEAAASGLQLVFVVASTDAETRALPALRAAVATSTGCCWCHCTATTRSPQRSSGPGCRPSSTAGRSATDTPIYSLSTRTTSAAAGRRPSCSSGAAHGGSPRSPARWT